MKLIATSLAFAVALMTGAAVAQQRTGEDRNPPPQSINNRPTAPPPRCEWVCMSWNNDGTCRQQSYVCN